jgi:hypothetical protein
MRIPLALLALLAAAPAAGAGPSSATLEALASHPAYHILSQRHGVSCDQLPVRDAADLAQLTEPALAPAYVPMRAAHCLVERFGAEAEPIVAPWMSDPGRSGQALVVVGALDALPADAALRLGTAALAGADERARERIARRLKASIHPQVAALGSD